MRSDMETDEAEEQGKLFFFFSQGKLFKRKARTPVLTLKSVMFS